MSYDFAIYQKVGVEKYKRQSHHDMDEERDTSLEKRPYMILKKKKTIAILSRPQTLSSFEQPLDCCLDAVTQNEAIMLVLLRWGNLTCSPFMERKR